MNRYNYGRGNYYGVYRDVDSAFRYGNYGRGYYNGDLSRYGRNVDYDNLRYGRYGRYGGRYGRYGRYY